MFIKLHDYYTDRLILIPIDRIIEIKEDIILSPFMEQENERFTTILLTDTWYYHDKNEHIQVTVKESVEDISNNLGVITIE